MAELHLNPDGGTTSTYNGRTTEKETHVIEGQTFNDADLAQRFRILRAIGNGLANRVRSMFRQKIVERINCVHGEEYRAEHFMGETDVNVGNSEVKYYVGTELRELYEKYKTRNGQCLRELVRDCIDNVFAECRDTTLAEIA